MSERGSYIPKADHGELRQIGRVSTDDVVENMKTPSDSRSLYITLTKKQTIESA